MNRRYITLPMLLLVLSLSSGCGTNYYKGYEGPTLPESEIAVLSPVAYPAESGQQFCIEEIDGKPTETACLGGGQRGYRFELLPGQHTVSTVYATSTGGSDYYYNNFGSRAQTAFTLFTLFLPRPKITLTEGSLTFEAEAGHTYEISPNSIEDTTFAWIEGAPAASLVTPPARPINFERDRPEIIKAIREYYDGPGETYDHPNSSLGGTMGTLKSLTKLHLVGDQIEVAAKYTWLPNSDWGGQMESPHDGRFVLERQGDTYKVVKMWSKNFGWKPDKRGKTPAEKEGEKLLEKFLVAAEKGDREAQFQLYRVSRPSGKSLTWLCLAANQGYAPAQEEFGDLHAGKYGGEWNDADFAEPDRVRAYMWYSLAASSGHRRARFSRNTVANQMTPAQIAEAEKLAAEWKPRDCGA